VIHPRGTFDYVCTMPDLGSMPWTLRLHTDAGRRNPSFPSLAGSTARLEIEEAGLTPNAGYERATWRPEVLRARFRLAAGRWSLLKRTVAHFHLDLSLAKALRSGDALHLSRTGCGGVGVSAVRDGELVFAVGAVTAVALGKSVSVRVPRDLIVEAEAVFRRRDPTFELPELPLEISVGRRTLLLLGSQERFAGYEVRVFAGFRPGMPGTNESVAISRCGLCSQLGANASAQLLAADGLRCD
jgi:hypothetical protein